MTSASVQVQQQPTQPKQIEDHPVTALVLPSSEPDPDDPKDNSTLENDGNKPTWAWRLAKYAIPIQLAIVVLLCAACLMEPHCCDGQNNYAWSMSPQLRYVRGPPPIWSVHSTDESIFFSTRNKKCSRHTLCDNKFRTVNSVLPRLLSKHMHLIELQSHATDFRS